MKLTELKMDITENLERTGPRKLDEKIVNAEKNYQQKQQKKSKYCKLTIQQLRRTIKEEQEKYDSQKRNIVNKRVVALYEAGDTQC